MTTLLSKTLNSVVIDDIWDTDTVGWSAGAKTNPPIVFNDDPLALACGSYRIWIEDGLDRWTDLESVIPTDADRIQAIELRRYYRDRVLVQALKSNNGASMTEFRKKLFSLVNGTLDITKEEIGLLHRMPYFYAEDLAMDEIVAQFTSLSATSSVRVLENKTGTFTLFKRVLHSRRSAEHIHFWFTSDIDDSAYNLVVKKDNPLLYMLDSLVEQPQLKLSANMYFKFMRGHPGFNYYQMGNLKLV